MDAAQALADLAEVSMQIEGAVLAGADGALVASTFADEGRGERVAQAALALLAAAGDSDAVGARAELTQVLAEVPGGAVFVVRDADRVVAAVTGAEPTVGLVFYDLKTCLRLAAEAEPPEPAASPRRKAPVRRQTSTTTRKRAPKKDDA
jgi:predicted regulator of Ras-like GTPase activity (Roadblock/LC7/MglB family)